MGTVEYSNSHDVEEAIRRFNGANFMQREIFVRQDNPPPVSDRRERRGTVPTPRRAYYGGFEIFVANLPYSINWQALKDMFKECGDVIHADVSVDADGYSRGFGTVYVATKDNQLAAIKKWNGFEIEGRVLEVRKGKGSESVSGSRGDSYIPKGDGVSDSHRDNRHKSNLDTEDRFSGSLETPQEESNTASNVVPDTAFTSKAGPGGERSRIIYCENMPPATVESDLYDLFETIGKVVRASLKYDEEGNSKGVSVCEFETTEDAEECIQRLNNYHYGGCDLKISYAKYQ
ncbi:uncharacterized protein Ecym_1302 [Eremothecium cymbalariae DBVPG|uniref:RRM domain-containing protein n=1 Tax=Eremothecium cymbalariae (strain CBS 270.75 / DBVPG 7215 / KCTC 17166 / NRRL Y-17582) TaxID=931890 RepID=G8JN76_ERECY|nr:hypothetical protein Ecym_1302 [Eremothecium cymbalariae DBVPG\